MLSSALQNCIFRRKFQAKNSSLAVIETKIFIALIYYAVFGIVALSDYALFTENHNNYISEVQKYFVCEAMGSGSKCDRSRFERQQRTWLHGTAYVLLGLLPLVNVIFVVSWKSAIHHLKNIWENSSPGMKSKRAKMSKDSRQLQDMNGTSQLNTTLTTNTQASVI